MSIVDRQRPALLLLTVVLGAACCGCPKPRSSPRRAGWSTATVIAMFSNGSRDMFAPQPGAIDGSVTSIGASACLEERRHNAPRLLLRTDGGYRECSGRQPAAQVEAWAQSQDAIAVVCAADDQLLVLANGTLWARTDPRSAFRIALDCRPQWFGNTDPCLQLGDNTATIAASADLCRFAQADGSSNE